jgi:transposase
MTTLIDDLLPDELWTLVERLLPAPPRPPYGGRHRVIPDRTCFAAIVYMARTSIPWRLLPARELGCGSPATCWRRLTEWAKAGLFDALHLQVFDQLGMAGRLDWSRARVDSASVRAKRGGTTWAQIPVDRGKPGSKLHLVCDGGGLPLTVVVTAATVNDTTMFCEVVGDIPPIRTPSARRRWRPGKVHAEKGYDSAANRAWLRHRGIRARIARRGVDSSARLGRHRWKVERSLSWLSCWRRLQVRWDRDSGRWFAFVLVACAVVCFNRLAP